MIILEKPQDRSELWKNVRESGYVREALWKCVAYGIGYLAADRKVVSSIRVDVCVFEQGSLSCVAPVDSFGKNEL